MVYLKVKVDVYTNKSREIIILLFKWRRIPLSVKYKHNVTWKLLWATVASRAMKHLCPS